MKKLFSKRSGFTLVEILVAFVIFALMASMILSIMSLAIAQRRQNNELADSIEAQKAELVRTEKNMTYSGTADGSFTFDFTGVTSYSMDYSIDNVLDNPESNLDGINYFVGDVKYDDNLSDKGLQGGDGDTLSLVDKLDSRIYGSANFDFIKVYGFTEISGPIYSNAKLYKLEISAKDNDTALDNVDTIMSRNYKVKFPTTVIDCGYIKNNGDFISYRNAVHNLDGTISGTSEKFDVTLSSSDTIRISIPDFPIEDAYNGSLDPTSYHFNGQLSTFYVLLYDDGTLGTLDTSIFGDNGVTEGMAIKYTPYVEDKYDDDGNYTGTETHLNVYGAICNSINGGETE